MFTKATRVVVLGALVVASAAWAAPDFTAQMTLLKNANPAGQGNVFDFLDPAVADLNENGLLDATEFALLGALIDANATVSNAHTANIAAVKAAVHDGVETLLGPSVNDALSSVLAAYVTMGGQRGGEKQFNIVNTVVGQLNNFVAAPPNVTRASFDESAGAICGVCGDADGDGVLNLHEGLAAASPAAFVAAAQDPGTTDAGADTLGGCVFKFDADPGPGARHWYYNPGNGNIYFVGSALQGNLLPSQFADFAANFTINGLPIPDGHMLKIDDADENAFLAGLKPSGSYWTGGSDAATEGQWRWHDGTQFWQGAVGGSAVGDAYTNWNSGEPNNSGEEDYLEFQMGSGGWNDDGVDAQEVIIEFEGDYVDSNSDGIPDGWTDNNGDGLPDGFTISDVIITPANPTVKAGLTIQLTANSSPGDTEWAWSSNNTSVATVQATGKTVTVTGVAPGTATISVEVTASTEGKELGSTGQVVVTVIPPEWFDLCEFDNVFAGQLTTLASFGLDDEDLEGDGVPDAWQVQLLAYALCKGGSGVPAEATAAFDANIAALNASLVGIATGYAPFVANIVDQLDEIAALAAKFETTAQLCDDALAGNGVPSVAAVLNEVVESSVVLGQLASAHVLLSPDFVGSGLAALATTSTEMGLTLNAALNGLLVEDLQDNFDDILLLMGGIATFLGGCPDDVALDAANILSELTANGTTVPAIAWPSWVAAKNPAKAADEPLHGAGDYNQDDLTNAQVAAIVAAHGGDANDFIVAATGDFGPFWPGNPDLPVGVAVLGGLVGAFAVGGAVSIRRRRKS